MNRRAMALAVALLVTAAGVATAAGIRAGADPADHPDRVGAATGSVTRLGPTDGEPVQVYLDRARTALDGVRGDGYALVAFDRYLPPAQAAALPGRVRLVRALVRVPLPRVQTEIVEVPARTRADIAGGMTAAATRLYTAAGADDPVSAAVDRAQADRLRTWCACVFGAVVRADRAALLALAGTAGVRVVEPAPPGEPLARLAFAPLLPEQRVRVEPPPDEGAAALAAGAPTTPTAPGTPGTPGTPRVPGTAGPPGAHR